MKHSGREIPAGQFKAKCLSILDEVASTGAPVVVTKRGKPVAKVVPVERVAPRGLRGSVLREKDIVSPVGMRWDASQ